MTDSATDPIDPTVTADAQSTDAQTTEATVDAMSTGAEQGEATPIEAAQREIADLKDKHLRLAAEFDNFRRRAAKERQEAGWRAQGELVRGLLDVLDDITRFATVDPSTLDSKTVVDGIQLVEKKLHKSLAGHGFEVIDATGKAFDPALHEAVSTAPAASAEEDGVVAVCFQSGYVINGHVLRPARVVVKQWNGN
ncbi:MAG: nucleotide exchange factor GrpE [Gemmatimonas sp.]|uniref:nucleotide exchange factor GrpE n=1 Tax=Gemmatimonas sp. UBA7669 TaxID=1946568 RepID=UPI0025BE3313|nr:nucleotide exchange factor GrpE [Gemmatimonas sp. UBA7669]MBA3917392.1 nucleotide exchange factor GrpE [Gemmatimonas sp.]